MYLFPKTEKDMQTKIPITKEIQEEIRRAIVRTGSMAELARLTKVNYSTIKAILSTGAGEGRSITRAIWNQLFPYLYPDQIPQRPMVQSDFTDHPEVSPVEIGRFRNVPVLTFAQAAGYEPALVPLCDYIKETSETTRPFIDVPDTWFALEIRGESMEPDYPAGSIVLVAAGEFPSEGDIVVAKLATGQVVLKEYHRDGDVVSLSSRNPDGKVFTWQIKEQPGYIQWMYPVVQIIISPRAQRHSRFFPHRDGRGE